MKSTYWSFLLALFQFATVFAAKYNFIIPAILGLFLCAILMMFIYKKYQMEFIGGENSWWSPLGAVLFFFGFVLNYLGKTSDVLILIIFALAIVSLNVDTYRDLAGNEPSRK